MVRAQSGCFSSGVAASQSIARELPAAIKLYVDELFDRTIVALDALLEPIGIDAARTKFAPGFMAELAAIVQVATWENAGIRHLIPIDFPPAAKAMSDLVWRYHVDPMSFMEPAAGVAVFNRVAVAWAIHCHPDARAMFGFDVVISCPPDLASRAAAIVPSIVSIADKTKSKEDASDTE